MGHGLAEADLGRRGSRRPGSSVGPAAVVWSKRRRDLASSRTQVVCRLDAVLCELVPGGVPKKIIAAHAARLPDSITPPDAIAAARRELAAALIEDLRRIDGRLRETRNKPDAAVRASGTT